MVVVMEMKGAENLILKISNLSKSLIKKVDEALDIGAELVWNNARAYCPVKTGLLQSTIRTEHPDIMWYQIIAGDIETKYGVAQEYGFRHYLSGKFIINPFMRPALETASVQIIQEVRKAIKLE